MIEQLECVERRRVLQSRVVTNSYEELKRSRLKGGVAKDLEPVFELMELFSEEMNTQNELLIKLSEGVK